MNHENTIVYLAGKLAEAETALSEQTRLKEYWYKSWKEASDKVADLQLIVDSSAPEKEAE